MSERTNINKISFISSDMFITFDATLLPSKSNEEKNNALKAYKINNKLTTKSDIFNWISTGEQNLEETKR